MHWFTYMAFLYYKGIYIKNDIICLVELKIIQNIKNVSFTGVCVIGLKTEYI